MENAPNPPADSSGSRSGQQMITRTVPRYTFVAVAEIVEIESKVCIVGRVSEISRKGCYVDTLNPLPLGTSLSVVISRDQGNFATRGKVIYVHEGIGMGVAFLDLSHDQLKILDGWLAELPVPESPGD
jgi:PilZ domain